jgi:hypothetical protein
VAELGPSLGGEAVAELAQRHTGVERRRDEPSALVATTFATPSAPSRSRAPSSAAYTDSTTRTRSTVSIARPKADETCSRLAIRRIEVEWFVPAAWKSAGLKKTASPLARGSWMWCEPKYSWNSGRR